MVTLEITNEFPFQVLFHYSIETTTITITLGPKESKEIRVSTGDLDYWVTDIDNELVLDDEDGDEIFDNITISAQTGISFGFTEVTPELVALTSLFDYLLIIIVFSVVVGAFAFLATRSNPSGSSKKRTKSRVSLSGGSIR